MEWLASILNNPNSWKSFIFFFITLITLIILVKKAKNVFFMQQN